ncbi:MAG: hypothetical protein GVY35_07550 [Bacteroidetes bacterium]|jgi:hypothetical protein|nr:hypothetical protein [Bacteroidota bacterium]
MTEPTSTHRLADVNPTLEARFAPTDRSVTRPFEKLIERLGPHAVFGEAIRSGRTTVIPVAELRTGFGFGSGHDHEAPNEGGGGGGAGIRVAPRGYIVMREGRVRYRPIRGRFGPLALAGVALAAGLVLSMATAWRS